MKMLSLTKSLVLSFTLLGSLGGLLEPSQAQSSKGRFSCELNRSTGLPTTYFYNSKGRRIRVVNWYSQYFSGSGYTPSERCDQVTSRFQEALERESLGFVTTGFVNGLPVVCSTAVRGGCNAGNVLFTLKPGTNVPRTVQQLFDIGSGRATAPKGGLWESSADDDSISINMTQFLEAAPSEGMTSEPNSPSATPDMPTVPESNGTSGW